MDAPANGVAKALGFEQIRLQGGKSRSAVGSVGCASGRSGFCSNYFLPGSAFL